MRFLMQAFDSVTSAMFTWLSDDAADFAGDGYPGPNSPQHIAVVEQYEAPGRWGTVVAASAATYSPTAAEVNAGLLINAGRDGGQTIALPTSGLLPGVAVLVVAEAEAVSSSDPITITGPADSVQLTERFSTQSLVWNGARWVTP